MIDATTMGTSKQDRSSLHSAERATLPKRSKGRGMQLENQPAAATAHDEHAPAVNHLNVMAGLPIEERES